MTRMKVLTMLFCLVLICPAFTYGQSCPYGESPSSNCSSPRTIAGWPGQHVVLMDVNNATGTDTLCGVSAGNIVYFSVTPEVTGLITVSTCHPHTMYDTVIEVVSGTEFCGGTFVDCNDDTNNGECHIDCSGANRASEVTFYGYSETSYVIRVGSYYQNPDGCPLCLGLIVTIGSPCGDPPRNFICDVATEIPGTFGSHDVQADITDMASFPGSFGCRDNVGNPVWYKFTAAIDGIATFTTCRGGTEYDTVIRALTGNCGGTMAQVACNDDSSPSDPGCTNACGTNRGSKISFSINAGQEYFLEAGAYNDNASGCELCLDARLTIAECTVNSDCDDGNPCTVNTCGAGTCATVTVSAGTPCGDSSNTDCTNPDTCNGSGQCLPNNDPSGTLCTDDGNACTYDQCNGSGSCLHPYKPSGSTCGDQTNTACTDPDMCNGSGQCLPNNDPSGTLCTDDGNACTYDQCNGSGSCLHPYKPSGSTCGDQTNTACTDPDTCNGSGQCLPNNAPSGTPCPDSLFCNGSETCNASGTCLPGTPPCQDPDETCNEAQDLCEIILSGYVYSGEVGDESFPLSEVNVALYCSDSAGQLGSLLSDTTTAADGRYELQVSTVCPFYNLLETDPDGYRSVGADSTDGTVVNANWIQLASPLTGKTLSQNNFWDLFDPAPGNWTGFTPVDCVTSQEVTCTVQVQDSGSGLEVSSAEYAYSTDGGSSWSNWQPAACSGTDGTMDPETISANVDFGQDSGPSNLNRIRFRIADLGGTFGVSGVYNVNIDSSPPQITTGPTVSDVTANSVRISWQTNEDSDSLVKYGRGAMGYDAEKTDPSPVTSHALVLTGLDPSAIYRFQVQSTDACGIMVEEHDLTFETQPLPDSVDPTVSIIDPGILEGTVTISADAFDNMGIEKVEFYLDDSLIFTDYSSNYSCTMNTLPYENKSYTLMTKAYDLGGRTSTSIQSIEFANVIDTEAPTIVITQPAQWDTVSGNVTITADLHDDTGLKEAYFIPDDYYMAVGHDDSFRGNYDATANFTWISSNWENGNHRINIEVFDNQGKSTLASVDVNVYNEPPPPPEPPELILTNRQVSRNGTYFEITLSVKNIGGQEAYDVKVDDKLTGFQPFDCYSINYCPDDGFTICEIDNYSIPNSIPPGETRNFIYKAVPVLIYPNPPIPQFGKTVKLAAKTSSGQPFSGEVSRPILRTQNGDLISDAHKKAVKASDYLIVTNPKMLNTHYVHKVSSQDDTLAFNHLLSNMAELASLKEGVLGYINIYDRDKLKDLIWGDWGKMLSPKFWQVASGYLLIVGETEIIPSWNMWYGGPFVPLADEPYSTPDENTRVSKVVSRIIGNDTASLSKPIEASIGVYKGWEGYEFDRSSALLVSGNGNDDLFPGYTEFIENTNDMKNILSGKGVSASVLHWSQIPEGDNNGDGVEDRREFFKDEIADTDIIVYRGHGGSKIWHAALSTGYFPLTDPPNSGNSSWGNDRPIVFAFACNTGNYEYTNDDGTLYYTDESIAKAFLNDGVAVYFGATTETNRSTNSVNAKDFFRNWDNWEYPGQTFVDLVREISYYNWLAHNEPGVYGDTWFSETGFLSLWGAQYNFYGDPKFGAVEAPPSTALNRAPEDAPVTSIQITVPDYQVNRVDGIDHVEIPGGKLLIAENLPLIPFYFSTIDYPEGYEIQDVTLIEKSGLMTETGLNLPIASMETDYPETDALSAQGVNTGWLPPQELTYGWHAEENPDGTTTLVIFIYPFHYRPSSGDVEFYKNFQFDIIATASSTEITELNTDKSVYPIGEVVNIDLEIYNSGPSEDMVVNTLVREYASTEAVGSTFLESLDGLTGKAAFSDSWDSSGFEPGLYVVEVTLQKKSGEILDRSARMFELGIAEIETTSFSAAPEHFAIGDPVTISMEIGNIGSLSVSGTVIMKVQDETGQLVQTFRNDFAELPENDSLSIVNEWDSSEAAGGSYQVIGYVLFNSKSNDPATAVVSTRAPCEGDFNGDRDVDGSDLAVFSADFGRTDCGQGDPCEGDFDSNNNVDDLDLTTFSADFGRTDCP